MYQDLQASFTKDLATPSATDNSAQPIVGAFGVAITSRNVIDMGKPANVKRNSLSQNAQVNVFDAACIPLHIQVVDDFAGNTGGLTVEIINADNAALSTNPVTLYAATIPLASLKKGYSLLIKELPMGIKKQFVGLKFTPLTANSTAGSVDAFITTAKDLTQF